MKVGLRLRKVGKGVKHKYRTIKQVIHENPREFLRFEIGLMIGIGWFLVLNSLIGLGGFLIGAPLAVVAIFLLLVIRLFGVEELAFRFWSKMIDLEGRVGESENLFQILPAIPDLTAEVIEMINGFSEAFTHLGKAIFANFTILFAILLDIQIDIDWLHVNFVYLIRTLFNIVQFAVMFYIYRKIKTKIKNKIKKEVEEDEQRSR